jgi:hypothetical protein
LFLPKKIEDLRFGRKPNGFSCASSLDVFQYGIERDDRGDPKRIRRDDVTKYLATAFTYDPRARIAS